MICIVSHDAGGAEVLASYVKQENLECFFVLAGPAVSVFERKFGCVEILQLEEAVNKSEWVLCSNSWQSDLEWKALEVARRLGKYTVSFLDHWGQYREGFVRNGEEHLPDEIWVGDRLAETRALRFFPELPVRLVPNPYFIDIKRDILLLESQFKASDSEIPGLNVLFVTEPLSEHCIREYGNERYHGYTEYDALHYFFDNINVLGNKVSRVVVRPHPSEPVGKYDWVSHEFGENAVVGGKRPLLEEIAESDVVVGCNSMAMVVGLIAGRRVINCIPPGGKPCGLPQLEIEALAQLIQMAVTDGVPPE